MSLLQHARRHLSEELGHAELFGACLLDAGCTLADLRALEPQLMTKALYGYLLVAVEDENEYISNIAVFQVMEAIGQCFFAATMQAIQAHGLPQEVFAAHSDGDDGHALLGIEQCEGFDEEHMQRSALIIHDLFQLMPLVFDAWMGPE